MKWLWTYSTIKWQSLNIKISETWDIQKQF